MSTFKDFDLLSSLQTTLAEKGFEKPTEIQDMAVPALLDGRSIVGVSETGSGKTLSYALPILHHLKCLEHAKDPVTEDRAPRALIVVPTRELGEQVTKVFKPFTHTTRLRVRSVLGGTTTAVAKKNIDGPLEVLVATPGRLTQLMERGLVNLKDVRVLVFDEADQMMDRGFLPDARKIAAACPTDRQLALFTATLSPAVQKLIDLIFDKPEMLKSQGSHQTVATLTTQNCEVIDGDRVALLDKILGKKVAGGTLIFTNTREQCDKLAAEFKRRGLDCAVYRGEMDKVERRRNLKQFRDGQIAYLISTDLASRGLDLEHVGRVINYHLPQHMENYIHRVGRTARAGRAGLVINFVTERDEPLVKQLDGIRSRRR